MKKPSDNKFEQNRPLWLVTLQGLLMLGILAAPAVTTYRLHFPAGPIDWLGTVLMLVGVALVLQSMYVLRKHFTAHAAVKDGTELVTAFPFNISRNPMYLGGLIMCLAWSVLQRSFLAGALSLMLLLLLNNKVRIEEKNLELIFGDKYLKYKKSVRRFI